MKKSKYLELKQINENATVGVPSPNKSKVLFTTLLFLCTLFLLASCDPDEEGDDKETSGNKISAITIAASQNTVEIEKSITLTVTKLPEGTSVTWISSDPSVASIDRKTGVLSAIALGTVTITAITNNLTSNTLSISVVPKSLLQISGDAEVHLGDTGVSYSAELNGTPTTEVTWNINNNAENQYGSIDNSGTYQAPKVWKQALGSAIIFSIEASSTQNSNVKESKQVIIKTDSFPNALEVTRANRAIYSNTSNRHLTIYLGVTEVGTAFRVSQLLSVTIPESVETIGYAAFDDNDLTSVTIPDSVKSIGQTAFQRNNLKSLTIPSSVTSIQTGAFYRNPLASLTLRPATVSIGEFVFDNNFGQLESVTLNSALWENIKGAVSTLFGNQVTSYTDLDGNVLVAAVFISTTQTTVRIGESITLRRSSTPTGIALAWSADNPAIATVDPATGVLTGVAEGTVKITARAGAVSSNELSIEIAANPPLKINGLDSVHFGDAGVQFTIATASPVRWAIKDNTDSKYGGIGSSNGRYSAPRYWKQADVPSAPITFTIEAVDQADANRKASKVITIKTDSFPHQLELPNNRFDVAKYTKISTGVNGGADLEVFLGVTKIASSDYFVGQFLRIVKLPKSVRSVPYNPFRNNPKLTKIILSASLWNSLKAVAKDRFGSQVSSYRDLNGNALLEIAATAPSTTLAIGSSITLVATTTPTGGTVTWAVDKPTLATIDASTGELTGVAAGTVKATATSGVVSSSVEITVQ